MTIEDVFAKLSTHLLEGLMFHNQLSQYYDFLGLTEYSRCHKEHFLQETTEFLNLSDYYVNCYNKLIPMAETSNPDVIPENWYEYSRQDVDPSTLKSAVKNGVSKWVEWEKSTKKLYEQMYQELSNLGEIHSANFVLTLIQNVSREILTAEAKQHRLSLVNFDISEIVAENGHYRD